jgi:hypothetical protein
MWKDTPRLKIILFFIELQIQHTTTHSTAHQQYAQTKSATKKETRRLQMQTPQAPLD